MTMSPPGSVYSAAWAKTKPARRLQLSGSLRVGEQAVECDAAQAHHYAQIFEQAISWSSQGAQLRSSSGVGLLAGGAQRTTEVIQRP